MADFTVDEGFALQAFSAPAEVDVWWYCFFLIYSNPTFFLN